MRQRALAILALALIPGALASADRIKIGDMVHEDVLIYQSSTMYYVKIPEEGSVFNVPTADIAEGDVEIILDPYYRDELKSRFEEVASGARAPARRSGRLSVFGAEPTGDTAPAATPMSLEEALELAGMVLSKEGGDTVAKSGDGSITLRIKGGEVAKGITFQATMPQAQIMQLGVKLAPALEQLGSVAPWTTTWSQQNIFPLIQNGGSAEHTEDGYHIELSIEKTDTEISVNMEFGPTT